MILKKKIPKEFYKLFRTKDVYKRQVYRTSWEEIVNNEIFRQRDKSNNNDIGYFHQNIFSYFKGCEVPQLSLIHI